MQISVSFIHIFCGQFRITYLNMQNRFEAIEIPIQLQKQKDFARRIEKINEDVYEYYTFLKSLILTQYERYLKCFQRIHRAVSFFEKSIRTYSGSIPKSLLYFAESLIEINRVIEKQLKKYKILMSTKDNHELKKLKNMVANKLSKTSQLVRGYRNQVKQFNELGNSYVKDAEYFKDIENDPIKYYSLQVNENNLRSIKKVERQLSEDLENIEKNKYEIKMSMIQVSIKIHEFYENVRFKVQELLKIEYHIREGFKNSIGSHECEEIQEANSSAEYSISEEIVQNHSKRRKSVNYINTSSGHTQTVPTQEQFKKRMKFRSAQRLENAEIKKCLIELLQNYASSIDSAFKEIEAVKMHKSFKKFSSTKPTISEYLPPKTTQDIDRIFIEFDLLQNILHRISISVNCNIFVGLSKEQDHIYQEYLSETAEILEKCKKKQPLAEISLARLTEIQNFFLEGQSRVNERYLQKIGEILTMVPQILKEEHQIAMPKVSTKMDLFAQRYFQVLRLPHFFQIKHLQNFQYSSAVLAYQKIVDSKRFKSVVNELESQFENTENKQYNNHKFSKASCCGLFTAKVPTDSKASKVKVNSYSCALMVGYFLNQGTLYIEKQCLRFKSYFNHQTFFGDTDICVAKRDIRCMIEGRQLASLKLTIVTYHGNLHFTSFFSNPMKDLMRSYQSEFENQSDHKFLQDIFNEVLTENLSKRRINILSRSSEQQQDDLLLEYIYTCESGSQTRCGPFKFLIRIGYRESQNCLRYRFDHSAEQVDIEIKRMLEATTRKAIENNQFEKIRTTSEQKQQLEPIINIFGLKKRISSIRPQEISEHLDNDHKLQAMHLDCRSQQELSSIAPPPVSNGGTEELQVSIQEPAKPNSNLSHTKIAQQNSMVNCSDTTVKYQKQNTEKWLKKKAIKGQKQEIQQIRHSQKYLLALIIAGLVLSVLNLLV